MLARSKLLGEVPEIAIGRDVRHGLAVHYQSRTGFCFAHDLRRVSDHLRADDLQEHFLRLALRHERKLENGADFTGLFLSVRRLDIPEVLARIEPSDLHGCAM